MKKLTMLIAICLVFFMAGSAVATPICGTWIRPPGTLNLTLDCNFQFSPPPGAITIVSDNLDPNDGVTPIYTAVQRATTCTQSFYHLPIYMKKSNNDICFDRTIQDYSPNGIGTITYSAAVLATTPPTSPLDTAWLPPPAPATILNAKLVVSEVYVSWQYAQTLFPGYAGDPWNPDLTYNWSNVPSAAVAKSEYVDNRWVGIILDAVGAETDYRVVIEWTQYPAGPPTIVCPGGQVDIPSAVDYLLLHITKALPGDINADGIVDINDYLLLSGNWLATRNICHIQDECAPISIPK